MVLIMAATGEEVLAPQLEAACAPSKLEALGRLQHSAREWQQSRASILGHDRAYWKDRAKPDPAVLFKDFWQWKYAPQGTDLETASPLQVFRGFWNDGEDEK